MHKLSLLSLFVLLTTLSHAQYVAVAGGGIQDVNGNQLAHGMLTIVPTNAADQPINAQVGGGGQVNSRGVSCVITSGAIAGGCMVADSNLTFPQNLCERFAWKDLATNQQLGYYKCVQPVHDGPASNPWCGGGTCNFALYQYPQTPLVMLAAGPPGPPLNPRGVWNSSTTYNVADLVDYGSVSYAAITSSLDLEPDTHPLNWQIIEVSIAPWEVSANTYYSGDWGAAVNTAIGSCAGYTNCRITTQAGTYNAATTVNYATGVTIEGSGWDTVINYTGSSYLFNQPSTSFTMLRDMSFTLGSSALGLVVVQGPTFSQYHSFTNLYTTGGSATSTLFRITGTRGNEQNFDIFNNIYLQNYAGKAFWIDHAIDIHMHSIDGFGGSYGLTSEGLVLDSGANGINLVDVSFSFAGLHAFDLRNTISEATTTAIVNSGSNVSVPVDNANLCQAGQLAELYIPTTNTASQTSVVSIPDGTHIVLALVTGSYPIGSKVSCGLAPGNAFFGDMLVGDTSTGGDAFLMDQSLDHGAGAHGYAYNISNSWFAGAGNGPSGCSTPSAAGMHISGGNQLTLSTTQIRANCGHGILIDRVAIDYANYLITGNEIYDNNRSAANYDGIAVTPYQVNGLGIINNKIGQLYSFTTAYGILLANASNQNVSIIGNNLSYNSVGSISNAGVLGYFEQFGNTNTTQNDLTEQFAHNIGPTTFNGATNLNGETFFGDPQFYTQLGSTGCPVFNFEANGYINYCRSTHTFAVSLPGDSGALYVNPAGTQIANSLVVGTGFSVNSTGALAVTSFTCSGSPCPGGSSSMIYPSAGVACSTGSAWCSSSYALGVAADDLVQLDGSAHLPAVNASALTALNPANLSGAVGAPLGGTGTVSPSAHEVPIAEGASAFNFVALGADQYLAGVGSSDPIAGQFVNCGDATHACGYSTSTHIWSNVALSTGGLASQAAYTVLANNTGSPAVPTAVNTFFSLNTGDVSSPGTGWSWFNTALGHSRVYDGTSNQSETELAELAVHSEYAAAFAFGQNALSEIRGTPATGQQPQNVIACIGDSITSGANDGKSWCTVMAGILHEMYGNAGPGWVSAQAAGQVGFTGWDGNVHNPAPDGCSASVINASHWTQETNGTGNSIYSPDDTEISDATSGDTLTITCPNVSGSSANGGGFVIYYPTCVSGCGSFSYGIDANASQGTINETTGTAGWATQLVATLDGTNPIPEGSHSLKLTTTTATRTYFLGADAQDQVAALSNGYGVRVEKLASDSETAAMRNLNTGFGAQLWNTSNCQGTTPASTNFCANSFLVSYSTNERNTGVSPATAQGTWTTLHNTLAAANPNSDEGWISQQDNNQTCLGTCAYTTQAYSNALLDSTTAWMATTPARPISFFNVNDLIGNETVGNNRYLYLDGVHLSDEGKQFVGEQITQNIVRTYPHLHARRRLGKGLTTIDGINASSAPTLFELAKEGPAGWTTAATGDTAIPLNVCVDMCKLGATGEFSVAGNTPLYMDGASVVGHYIVASTTTAGYGHDSGYTVNSPPPPPGSGCLEYLGIVTTAASGAGQIGDFNASNPFRPCASIVGATSPITISSGLVQLNNSSGTGVTNVPDIQYAPADTIVTTTSGMSTGCISTINIIKPTAATHYACKFDVSQTVASAGCTTQATIANQLNWIDNFSGLTVSGNNNIIMANSTLGSTSLANANLTSVGTTLTIAEVWRDLGAGRIYDAANGQVSYCTNVVTPPVGCSTYPVFEVAVTCTQDR